MRKSADYMPGQRLGSTRHKAEKHTSKILWGFTLLDGFGHFDIKMREGIGKEEGRWR
jgi:hypothetical protein